MIDSHMHLSLGMVYAPFNEEKLLEAMDTMSISLGLVSLVDVMEYGNQDQHDPLPTLSEYEGAQRVLEMLSSGRLFPLVWVRPMDTKKEIFFQYLADNTKRFYGFKFHPFHSRLPLNHDRWEIYFEVAKCFHWPIVIHTAIDEFSQPILVSRWAEKYEVPVVLVHMGLYTDHRQALEMMLRYPHVYGDTTWVKEVDLWPILEKAGPEKVLFGSDALVGGERTYEFYHTMCDTLRRSSQVGDWVLKRNAERLFGIVGQ
ncbi:MAG: amidohydrolase [Brevinematales bacterium]|nr:amidohydrolase [Brevinematales bacterium]